MVKYSHISELTWVSKGLVSPRTPIKTPSLDCEKLLLKKGGYDNPPPLRTGRSYSDPVAQIGFGSDHPETPNHVLRHNHTYGHYNVYTEYVVLIRKLIETAIRGFFLLRKRKFQYLPASLSVITGSQSSSCQLLNQ